MTQRISRLAASAAALLLASAAAAAAPATDTHSYLEAERTRTDGQVAPLDVARVSRPSTAADSREATAAERHFLFQLSRTDGSNQSDEVQEGGATARGIAQAGSTRNAN